MPIKGQRLSYGTSIPWAAVRPLDRTQQMHRLGRQPRAYSSGEVRVIEQHSYCDFEILHFCKSLYRKSLREILLIIFEFLCAMRMYGYSACTCKDVFLF